MSNVVVPIPGGRSATVTEPEHGQFPRTLGGAFEYGLTHFIYSALRVMGSGLGEFAGGFFVHFLELVKPGLVEITQPLLDEFLSIENLPAGFREFLERIRNAEGEEVAACLWDWAQQQAAQQLVDSYPF